MTNEERDKIVRVASCKALRVGYTGTDSEGFYPIYIDTRTDRVICAGDVSSNTPEGAIDIGRGLLNDLGLGPKVSQYAPKELKPTTHVLHTPGKYDRFIKTRGEKERFVDVYDVLVAFDVTDPAVAHAVKKCLAPGQRGAKSREQDIKEAIASLERALEL